MSSPHICARCGAALPADAAPGTCPNCLINLGLGTTSSPSARTFTPPSVQELNGLFPQLEITELIGQGGMGAVYKARQANLDREVAVKILPAEVADDPAFAERFAREARALARLNHPSIISVFDFGQTGNLCFFVMELVDGVNLRQLLQASQVEPEKALAIVPQICDALHYAHEEGVVHRDIKPENILIDRKGRVKIADFGLAKLLGRSPEGHSLTGTQQVMGTMHYMAPEQLKSPLRVDHRADIYSLGVVFYELLTGDLPMGRFAMPSERAGVHSGLDEVVLRTLEREPSRRYQYASQVKTDIETVGLSPATAAPAVGDDSEARRAVLGPAVGLAITGALNIAATVAVIVLWAYLIPAEADPTESMRLSYVALMLPAIMALACLYTGALMIVAGIRMKQLESRTLAIIASVLAMLPVHPAVLIGLPVGLWSLLTLMRSDVRSAFQRGPRRGSQPAPRAAAQVAPHAAAAHVAATQAAAPIPGNMTTAAPVEVSPQTEQQFRIAGYGLLVAGAINCALFGLAVLWVLGGRVGLLEMIILLPTCLLPGAIITWGANSLLGKRSRGLATAGAIVGLLPVSPAFLISLPFGIWALVLLSRADSHAYFASATHTPRGLPQKPSAGMPQPASSSAPLGGCLVGCLLLGAVGIVVLGLGLVGTWSYSQRQVAGPITAPLYRVRFRPPTKVAGQMSALEWNQLARQMEQRINRDAAVRPQVSVVADVDSRMVDVVMTSSSPRIEEVKRLLAYQGTFEVRVLADAKLDEDLWPPGTASRGNAEILHRDGKEVARWISVGIGLPLETAITRTVNSRLEVLTLSSPRPMNNTHVAGTSVIGTGSGPALGVHLRDADRVAAIKSAMKGEVQPGDERVAAVVVDSRVVALAEPGDFVASRGTELLPAAEVVTVKNLSPLVIRDLTTVLDSGPLPCKLEFLAVTR